MNIQKDVVVSIHYILKDDSGEVIQSSVGKPTLEYLQGHGNIVLGLEEALEGRALGDKVETVVPPEKGYGLVDPAWIQKAPRSSFHNIEPLEVGMPLMTQMEDGPRQFIVTEIGDEEVEVDGNHPLAGLNLHFSVQVEGIRPSTEKERDQGHPDIETTCQKPGCCD